MRYRIAKAAEKELDEIFVYWAERAGLETAERIVDSITERFWLLAEYPKAGKPCEDTEPGMRCFPAGKCLVYYRETRRGTVIVHVFHRGRDQGRAWSARSKKP